MSIPLPVVGLTAEGCRLRQDRLRSHLKREGLDGALLSEPRYINYFTGYFQRGLSAAAAWVPVAGPVAVVTAGGEAIPAADVALTYTASQCATMVDDQFGGSLQALLPAVGGAKKIGVDQAPRPALLAGRELRDLNPALLKLRRTKDADEIVLIRRAIAGVEASYAAARKFLKPGMSEIEVFALAQQAAVESVGEPIGDFGNDFQAGTPGGPPRLRAIQAGELMPLDLSVIVRGYWADMCRTYCIGGKPTPAQLEAREKVMAALNHVERTAKPGVSCLQLFRDVHAMLDGHNGWSFMHHLGHGFGLTAHESPRLNPNYDDTLQVGDTFTCEPGLYSEGKGPDLKGGVRIEENFLVVPGGVVKLSSCSTEL
ncbi:MAG: Xaa-Pro peptidase family protein [Planctomycetota bacterium]|nr:Xaa-Pro peptidase family protein [Planctomycetota bacterium]